MSTPNKRPLGRPVQQQDGLPMSVHILQTASRLFMEKGFESVSMNLVAEQCGVTKATIYYYYPGKTDLFVASIAKTLSVVNDRIRGILSQSGSFRSRLIKITENYLRIPQVHMNDMFDKVKQHLTEEQQQTLIRYENGLYEALKEGFDAAVQNGEIACEDTMMAAHIYVSMLRVGERQYDRNQVLFPSEREAAESIIAFLWRGIHV
ncbi:TetR/AcrR family transcriptional regulator [Paenibacillus sp. FSL R5-0407]|uniref:TetR/AcrR family transcriptional regulator n=1 Tax=Paenibacillus TaxID=44249 RepID=UPI0025B6D7E1|nr:TetR/AcrR family transcriptional regulator [Paenibacillus vini]MDN4068169.1 TetR/AcrR family transcriptional regulator [Paenibacillus vini]